MTTSSKTKPKATAKKATAKRVSKKDLPPVGSAKRKALILRGDIKE